MAVKKIRVFYFDDDQITACLYRHAFSDESDLEFVGSLATSEGLLEAIKVTHPTVILFDLFIPGCDTLEVMSDIHAHFPDLAILIVSGLEDSDVIGEAFRRGASGFFLKTIGINDLLCAIRRVASGEQVNTGPTPTFGNVTHRWVNPSI